MTPKQEQIMKDWVAALRSGEYEQGKGQLRSVDDKYCCLGVLCEVMKIPHTLSPYGEMYRYKSSTGIFPPEYSAAVGISSVGSFKDGDSLANMNDSGMTFAQIADVIESRAEELFNTEGQP